MEDREHGNHIPEIIAPLNSALISFACMVAAFGIGWTWSWCPGLEGDGGGRASSSDM